MKRITLLPSGESAVVTTGVPLLAALRAKRVPVLASCGGRGICSTCHVRVSRGMEQLSEVGQRERRTLDLVADTGPDSRLACQAVVYGDVEVRLPDGLYIERADDLLSLLGTPATQNILHPVTGAVLIPKGKRITRTVMEQSRHLDDEVGYLKEHGDGRVEPPAAKPTRPAFIASGGRFTPPPRPSVVGVPVITPSPAVPVSPPAPSVPTVVPRSPPQGPSSSNTQVVTCRPLVPPPPSVARSTTTGGLSTSLAAGQRSFDPPTPTDAVQPGMVIDKYLLIECVGTGGAGVVYRALHLKLNSLVAIKFLRPDLDVDAATHARFTKEAQLLARLTHPNVVRVLDFDDHPSRPYVVMEFVDGMTAAELIRQSGRLTPPRANDVAADVAAGLEAAFAVGVIHRDVKPGNILVNREGRSKLLDLGLAAAPNTAGGVIEGTVAYMAPEVWRGEPADHRSDIYSLGATLFHMVAGRLPFAGRSAKEVALQHQLAPPPSLLDYAPDVSPELSNTVSVMMAKDPDERFHQYKEVRTVLLNLAQPGAATVAICGAQTHH